MAESGRRVKERTEVTSLNEGSNLDGDPLPRRGCNENVRCTAGISADL